MAKNKSIIKITTKELLEADSNLSCVKAAEMTFTHENISVFNNPRASSLHFIKSLHFWNLLQSHLTANNITNIAVIADLSLKELILKDDRISLCLISTHLELSMARLSKLFFDNKYCDINLYLDGRISGTATIHPSAKVSPQAFIGEYVVIDEHSEILPGSHISAYTHIGKNCFIAPRVTVYSHVQMGNNCRIHSGTVIGADGFGYVFNKGEHVKIWHIGSVILKNNIEIGANSCVDAGTFAPTFIDDGCIIDNLVQVAHNTQLGKGVVICGQAGTGGSSKAGDFCVMGGKAALGPQCELGKYTKVAGAGMVTKSWGESMELAGHPARPLKEWLKNLALVNQLSKDEKRG